MFLHTLGNLELKGADFRRPKPLLLLAYLALEGPQERGHLAELFFGGSKKTRANLSVALSRLRHGAPGSIRTDDVRVRAAVQTDAERLLEALEKGETQQGLSLYAGRFLEGVSLDGLCSELEEWVYGTRDYLASQVQKARLKLAEAEAAKGHYAQAAKRAESAYKLAQMTADPDTLGRLHTLLLAGGSLVETKLREEADFFDLPLCRTRGEAQERLLELFGGRESPPTNVQARDTSFVGRDLELAEIAQLLSENRLVTLIGPGGVGKSRLAVQTAQQHLGSDLFKDGIFFIALDALTSISAIPTSIASALSLTLQGSSDPLTQLKQYLVDKQILLVLDNFEHLIEGATFVSELLAACSKLRLLVTSRERLNLEEEWRYEVGGLSYPKDLSVRVEDAKHFDAVQLFVSRAQQANPAFLFDEDNLLFINQLCQLVEGLPLALELAATWVRVMTCEAIIQELEKNLDVLSTSTRNIPDKHKSIHASFEHSWQLLTEEEQSSLAKLAVFRGGFTREAAQNVTGTGLSRLASLLDKSLLTFTEHGRYGSHPLIHSLCQKKLAGQGDVQLTFQQHANYFLTMAEQAEFVEGPDQVYWLSRLEQEHDNLLTVLERALMFDDLELALKMAGELAFFWEMRGYYQLGRSWLERLVQLCPSDKYVVLKSDLLYWAGSLALRQGDYLEARRLFEASFLPGLTREETVDWLIQLGNISSHLGEYEEAYKRYKECLTIYTELGHNGGISSILSNLGSLAATRGDYSEARQYFEQSLEIKRAIEEKNGEAHVLRNLAALAIIEGDYTRARRYYEQSLSLSQELGEQSAIASSLIGLADLAVIENNHSRAGELFIKGLNLQRNIGNKAGIATSLEEVAILFSKLEQTRSSLRLLAAAEGLRRAICAPVTPDRRDKIQQAIEQGRKRLGDDAADILWKENQTAENVLDFALGELDKLVVQPLTFVESFQTVTPGDRTYPQFQKSGQPKKGSLKDNVS